jgi:hypothetical protein
MHVRAQLCSASSTWLWILHKQQVDSTLAYHSKKQETIPYEARLRIMHVKGRVTGSLTIMQKFKMDEIVQDQVSSAPDKTWLQLVPSSQVNHSYQVFHPDLFARLPSLLLE